RLRSCAPLALRLADLLGEPVAPCLHFLGPSHRGAMPAIERQELGGNRRKTAARKRTGESFRVVANGLQILHARIESAIGPEAVAPGTDAVTARIAILLAIACATARADSKAEADALFAAGARAYELKDYDGAARSFRAAYDLVKDPVYLFNIAQAFRMARHCRQ